MPRLAVAAEGAAEVSAVSMQMSANTEETAAQANMVSVAGEQVSKSVETVADGVGATRTSIREIGKGAAEATCVTASRSGHPRRANVSLGGQGVQRVRGLSNIFTPANG
jgi:methyl-accepting chemotaxis protein